MIGPWRTKPAMTDEERKAKDAEARAAALRLPEDFPFEVTRAGTPDEGIAGQRYVVNPDQWGFPSERRANYYVVAEKNYTGMFAISEYAIARAARLLHAEAEMRAEQEGLLGKYPPKTLEV
jgi:hypothetical protein